MVNFGLLTYIGTCPVEWPYETVGLVCRGLYFLFFFMYPFTWFIWEEVIFGDTYCEEDVYALWYESTYVFCDDSGNK